MTRPLIDYIYAQHLPWEGNRLGPARRDVAAKILSEDQERGELSAIVRYPPGWRRSEPEALGAEEEFYVLDGEIVINGRAYHRDCYACLPAGHVRETASSPEGCVALTFYDRRPVPAETLQGSMPGGTLVEMIDLYLMPWDTDWAPSSMAWMDPRRKVLRWNSELDQVATVVFAKPPHAYPKGWSSPMLSHPCAEESFVLAGELIGERGRQRAGAYVWRPAGVPHATLGSRIGGMSLARMRHGKIVNDWDGDALAPFSFDAPYDPRVPSSMMESAKDYAGADSY
jgi:Domain of unknown function (DUF4437)